MTIFIEIMQVGVSVVIMQLVFSLLVEFVYKTVKRVIQYFCFPDRPIKGGDILDF